MARQTGESAAGKLMFRLTQAEEPQNTPSTHGVSDDAAFDVAAELVNTEVGELPAEQVVNGGAGPILQIDPFTPEQGELLQEASATLISTAASHETAEAAGESLHAEYLPSPSANSFTHGFTNVSEEAAAGLSFQGTVHLSLATPSDIAASQTALSLATGLTGQFQDSFNHSGTPPRRADFGSSYATTPKAPGQQSPAMVLESPSALRVRTRGTELDDRKMGKIKLPRDEHYDANGNERK